MSFNTQANFVYQENPALQHGTGKIPMDASSISEITYPFQTNTAPRVQGVGEDPSYNGVETLFDVRIPAASRVLFDKSYFKVTGYAANMAIGKGSPVLLGTSIPWNSIAALFETAEVQLNQNATTTEQINQNLGDGSMVKFLTRYTREAIEAMDDSMYTPCFEASRDQVGPALGTTYLSAISQARRFTQLVEQAGVYQKPTSKNIYLADVFDSLRLPAAFYIQNLQFKIRPKMAADILIKDTVCLGVNAPLQKFFVTGISLYLTMVNLTENQLVIEREKILRNETLLLESFYSYDAIQKTHSQGASYRDSNIKNMQAAIFMFPSSSAADGIGVNPYQYVYGSGAGGATGVSSFQQKYDNIYSPAQPLAISNTAHWLNSDMFAQYRLICRKMAEREITPALRFFDFVGPRGTAEDESCYTLFCSQFYPQTAYGHKNMAGADHEIITSGGAVEPIVIVRIRLSFLEIRGDTSVNMIN